MLNTENQNKKSINKKMAIKGLGRAVLLTLGPPDRTFTELARPNAFPKWAKKV